MLVLWVEEILLHPILPRRRVSHVEAVTVKLPVFEEIKADYNNMLGFAHVLERFLSYIFD